MRNNNLFYSARSMDEKEEEKAKREWKLARARIGERPWLPLDNASKIFLSTMTSIDTKVFRLTAALAEDVRPELLQKALDKAYDAFPLYHSIIRRGFFWYFVEHSELRPKIEPERDIPCAQIYHSTYKGLLFRILYRGNRIHLEVFHALSDGNGALSFFQLLLIYYLQLCREADHRPGTDIVPYFVPADSSTDSFAENFFDNKSPRSPKKRRLAEKQKPSAEYSDPEEAAPPKKENPAPAPRHRPAPVYHIKGENTADGRMNVLEVHIRTSRLLAAARAAGGTITTYLCAVFMLAIARNMPTKKQNKARRIVLSVPVDLRQFFPSLTSRNFFATVMLEHTFDRELWPDPAELTAILTKQLKEKTTKEKIEKKVRGLVKLEHIPLVRIFPLYIKDGILRLANHINNLGITASMTNLGRFKLPKILADDLEEMNVMTSAVRPQFSVMSFEKNCAIIFTSPKKSTEIEETFRQILLDDGIEANFVLNADPPPSYEERKRAKKLAKQPEAEKQEEAKRILSAGPGRILKLKDNRRSSKHKHYPFVPLSFDLSLTKRLLTIGSLLILLFAFLGNTLWHWGLPWTLPMLGLATLWLVVSNILRNRNNFAWSVLQQSLILGFLVVIIDYFIGWQGWSLSIALPIIEVCALAASQIALLVSRRALETGLLFIFASTALGVLQLLFIILRIVSPLWPSIVAVCLACVFLLVTAILKRKVLKEEWGRNWHL